MKVLQINSVCGIRSTGRICTDLAELLEREGHECKIAYGRESVPEQYQKYAVRIGNDWDVKLHALRARLFDCAGFGSKRATEKFIQWVREYDPDVIHLHNIHGYYINIEVLFDYLRESGKPVIWTLHDCWAFTGHCTHFDAVGCDKWRTRSCANCSQKHNYPESVFQDRSSYNLKQKMQIFANCPNLTLVTPSRWLADLVQESFLGYAPTYVLPNGIDLAMFRPTESDFRAEWGLIDKTVVLAVASCWHTYKGYDDIIRLSTMLDEGYKIVMVGVTEEQKAALPSNVLGITRTNSMQELAEIYTAADRFINLTYEDNYPTVNFEAQACGTPVITYRTGGSPETLDPDSGIVVEKGDVEAVARVLRESAPRAVQMHASWDKQRCFAAYIDLYREVHQV